MFVREWGRGAPVIALHPLGLDSSGFEGFGRVLARRGLRTLAADLPGFGRTPAPDVPLRPAVLAEPVIELARSLDEPPVVLGISLGGRVALEAALQAPDAFRAVIPIAPGLPWLRYRMPSEGTWWPTPEQASALLPLERVWPALRWLAGILESTPYVRDDEIAQSAARFVYFLSCPATRASFFSAARELALDPPRGPDGFWTRLPGLQVPTSFVWGERDLLISKQFAKAVERSLPGTFQVLMPCVGHWLNGAHHRCLAEAVAGLVASLHDPARAAADDTAPVHRIGDVRLHHRACLVEAPAHPTLVDRLRALDPIAAWAAATEREVREEPFQRDVDFLGRLLPLMEVMNRYFDAEVTGFENVPASGPVLLVGNHSGGVLTPDTTAFFTAWYRARGLDSPLVALAFDAAFGIPGFRDLMRKIGEVPANRANASRALDAGLPVLVYPGGDHEISRPWSERDRIDFDGRKGFVELALRKRVPIVPVVSHGGHSSVLILSRGEWLGELFGSARVRTRGFPIALQIPWGISPLGLPGIPLPAKITTRVLPAIDWSHLGPDAADDPAVVERCYDEVVATMQATLDELAARRPYPVLSRLSSLLPFVPSAAGGTAGGG